MKKSLLKLTALFVAVMISALPGCHPSDQQAVKPAEKQINKKELSEADRIKKMVAKAVEDAKKTGKTRVDIYLDEVPGVIQTRDLATIVYTASLENGQVISASKNETKDIFAGEKTKIPGLGKAILGMKLNQKKRVTLSPEQAFGKYTNQKNQQFTALRTYPVQMEIPAQAYKKKFNALPKNGDMVQFNPYFKSRVDRVTDTTIFIDNHARNGFSEVSPFGTTTITVKNNTIQIFLAAQIGAIFPVGNEKGLIVAADEKTFTVDFNHPFAGQKLILDLDVRSIAKASSFSKKNLEWINDHDKGLEAALKAKKNKVLVLYADWCQWCERLFSDTFEDPRIKQIKDNFIWVKANSDKDKSLKKLYGQTGFPMIVFTDYKGTILKKISGYKDAPSLLTELELIFDSDKVVKAEHK